MYVSLYTRKMPVIEIGGRKFKVKKIRMSWIIHDDFVEYEVFSNDTFIFKIVTDLELD